MSSTLLPISIQQPFVFFPGNTVPFQWSLVIGSTANTTNRPVTDAVGTFTIEDETGTPVPGADGLAMEQTDTPGTYEATIDGTVFNPTPGSRYKTIIEMNSPSHVAQGVWTIATIIRPRTTA